MNIREKYNIPAEAKIVLYVGNVSLNKNQRALVSAFPLMEESLCEKTWVLFLGRYADDDDIIKHIEQSKYKDHLVLCGAIDKELVSEYYKQADATVLLSVAEGFGLSLIEGMHFGLPCMMPIDIDAFEDIYTSAAVIALKKRTDSHVADGLAELVKHEWNRDDIISFSHKFESAAMASKYVEFYKV